MRRVLLISLSLVLALVGWSAVCADDGFYVIPAMRGKYAPVPKTGQTVPYATGWRCPLIWTNLSEKISLFGDAPLFGPI
jgi:hypothetical protein